MDCTLPGGQLEAVRARGEGGGGHQRVSPHHHNLLGYANEDVVRKVTSEYRYETHIKIAFCDLKPRIDSSDLQSYITFSLDRINSI